MRDQTQILLDSGAYTAWTKGVKLDLDQYLEYVQKTSHLFLAGAFNLDVIGDGAASYKNWAEARRQGVDLIPVFHLGTDEKWLVRYMKQTDHISIGAIANLQTNQRLLGLKWVWNEYLTNDKGDPIRKVHGLGLNAFEIITMFPWYSVDSAAAIKAAAFGKIYVPKIYFQDGEWQRDYFSPILMSVSDQGKHPCSKGDVYVSYYFLPPSLQAAYTQYFNEVGYAISTPCSARKLRPLRRGDKNKNLARQMALFDVGNELQEGMPALNNNWNSRFEYNIKFWKILVKKWNATVKHPLKLFFVVSSKVHFEVIWGNDVPSLTSYAYLRSEKNAIFNIIQERMGYNGKSE